MSDPIRVGAVDFKAFQVTETDQTTVATPDGTVVQHTHKTTANVSELKAFLGSVTNENLLSGMAGQGNTQAIAGDFGAKLQANAKVIEQELAWFLDNVAERQKGSTDPITDPPQLNDAAAKTFYGSRVKKLEGKGSEAIERLALIMALIPYVKPDLLPLMGGDFFALSSLKALVGAGDTTANLFLEAWREESVLVNSSVIGLVGDPDPVLTINSPYRQLLTSGTEGKADIPATPVSTTLGVNNLIVDKYRRDALKDVITAVRSQMWNTPNPYVADYAAAKGVTAFFNGTSGVGKLTAAKAVCHDLGIRAFLVDTEEILGGSIERAEQALDRLFQRARHEQAAIIFSPAESFFKDVKPSNKLPAASPMDTAVRDCLIHHLNAHPGLVIAIDRGNNEVDTQTFHFQKKISFPFPSEPERVQCWETMLAGLPIDTSVDVAKLGHGAQMVQRDVAEAVSRATELSGDGPITIQHLGKAIQEQYSKRGSVWTNSTAKQIGLTG